MNSLKPQGLFLANHFDDVDTLLIKIIHYGRQTLFSSILLLRYVSSPRLSLFNQIHLSFFLIAFPFHSTETVGFFLCGFVVGIGTLGFFLYGFVFDLKVIALNQSFGSFVSSIASALALMSSHHQISSFSAPIQSTDRPPPLISL
ncbi:hypothetical protein HanHA300_Chr06g0220811 [Helianthus annuus]|nr:hypothetical protein HanHA300_Chr06g0220811 [Helianthus annuus]